MATRSVDSIAAEIAALAAAHFHVEASALGVDDDLFERLDLNSLQALELVSRLEMQFGVELPDYELQDASTVRMLAERIHRRL
jgi:acyl carrier protein